MERLICKSLLWKIGLTTGEEYHKTLDEMFLATSDKDILLDLESCSSDCETTFDILQRYWKYECNDFSVVSFGKCLLEDLKTTYHSNAFSVEDYGKMCYSLWQYFPNELSMTEPFRTLSYADDPLSWNDEKQTRKLYEELFEFYK